MLTKALGTAVAPLKVLSDIMRASDRGYCRGLVQGPLTLTSVTHTYIKEYLPAPGSASLGEDTIFL